MVAKMADLSVGGFRELLSNGVGGLLLLVPQGLSGKQDFKSAECKFSVSLILKAKLCNN